MADRWTYTRVYDERGDWLANRWLVLCNGQIVGRVRYVSHCDGSSYLWQLDATGAYGSCESLPAALEAVRQGRG